MNLIIHDVLLDAHHVTILHDGGKGLLVSYPTEQCAKRAYQFLLNVNRAYAHDSEMRHTTKPIAYIYSLELNVDEFLKKFQDLVEKMGYHTEIVDHELRDMARG